MLNYLTLNALVLLTGAAALAAQDCVSIRSELETASYLMFSKSGNHCVGAKAFLDVATSTAGLKCSSEMWYPDRRYIEYMDRDYRTQCLGESVDESPLPPAL